MIWAALAIVTTNISARLSLSLSLSPSKYLFISPLPVRSGFPQLLFERDKHRMEYENEQASRAKYDCLLFDLDDTLYPQSSGIAKHCSSNIQEYMVQKLGIDQSIVVDMCFVLYKYYGTTMAGLKAVGYKFNDDDYHSFVHGRLPYELLKPDPVLRSLLLSLPIRKVVLTNADKGHALRALTRLGLEDCFDGIICFETLNPTDQNNSSINESANSETSTNKIFDIMKYVAETNSVQALPKTPIVCKPFEEAFELAFKIAEIDPKRTLFFDDSLRNLLTAKQMGLHTVMVSTSQRLKDVDYALESIHNIKEAFPELMVANTKKEENIKYSQEIAIETSVKA
ncbi:hypothetical protein V2J09_011831 [Rumex salicifolius]